MIERIKVFMKSYNLSAADLAEKLEVQRSGISHLLSGRNNPSLSFVLKLMEVYPELNPDWILFNRGTMLRDGQTTIFQYENIPSEKDVVKTEQSIDIHDNSPLLFDLEEDVKIEDEFVGKEESEPNLIEPVAQEEQKNTPIEESIKPNVTNNGENLSESSAQKYCSAEANRKDKVDNIVLLYDDGTFKEFKSR